MQALPPGEFISRLSIRRDDSCSPFMYPPLEKEFGTSYATSRQEAETEAENSGDRTVRSSTVEAANGATVQSVEHAGPPKL